MLHVHVVRTSIIRKLLKTHLQKAFGLRPGRFPGIAGNAGNNGKDRQFHKSGQILDRTIVTPLFIKKETLHDNIMQKLCLFVRTPQTRLRK